MKSYYFAHRLCLTTWTVPCDLCSASPTTTVQIVFVSTTILGRRQNTLGKQCVFAVSGRYVQIYDRLAVLCASPKSYGDQRGRLFERLHINTRIRRHAFPHSQANGLWTEECNSFCRRPNESKCHTECPWNDLFCLKLPLNGKHHELTIKLIWFGKRNGLSPMLPSPTHQFRVMAHLLRVLCTHKHTDILANEFSQIYL